MEYELSDGTPVIVTLREYRTRSRPVFNVKEAPGHPHPFISGQGQDSRLFYADGDFKHLYNETSLTLRKRATQIDWTKPVLVNGKLTNSPIRSGSDWELTHQDGSKFEVTINAHTERFETIYFSEDASNNFGWVGYDPITITNANSENTNMIDTTKPLVDADNRKATFITETSEGHILVSVEGADSKWTIFDTQGNFVRSETGNGASMRLMNKVERKGVYLATGKNHIYSSRFETEWHARNYVNGSPVLKIVTEDGIVVSADVLPA